VGQVTKIRAVLERPTLNPTGNFQSRKRQNHNPKLSSKREKPLFLNFSKSPAKTAL